MPKKKEEAICPVSPKKAGIKKFWKVGLVVLVFGVMGLVNVGVVDAGEIICGYADESACKGYWADYQTWYRPLSSAGESCNSNEICFGGSRTEEGTYCRTKCVSTVPCNCPEGGDCLITGDCMLKGTHHYKSFTIDQAIVVAGPNSLTLNVDEDVIIHGVLSAQSESCDVAPGSITINVGGKVEVIGLITTSGVKKCSVLDDPTATGHGHDIGHNGGIILINADSVVGNEIVAIGGEGQTIGNTGGNGGDIEINVKNSVWLNRVSTDGGEAGYGAAGLAGSGGQIKINADKITIDTISANGALGYAGSGKGGGIEIKAKLLSANYISAEGGPKGGEDGLIDITADEIDVAMISPKGDYSDHRTLRPPFSPVPITILHPNLEIDDPEDIMYNCLPIKEGTCYNSEYGFRCTYSGYAYGGSTYSYHCLGFDNIKITKDINPVSMPNVPARGFSFEAKDKFTIEGGAGLRCVGASEYSMYDGSAIEIKAKDVTIDGKLDVSGGTAQPSRYVEGNGGNIDIITQSLTIGGEIIANGGVTGRGGKAGAIYCTGGNGGKINIDTNSIDISGYVRSDAGEKKEEDLSGNCAESGTITIYYYSITPPDEPTEKRHFSTEPDDKIYFYKKSAPTQTCSDLDGTWCPVGQECDGTDLTSQASDAGEHSDQICCKGTCYVPLSTCSQQGGTCCSEGQECDGGLFTDSSDCGALCCVGGTCQTPTPPTPTTTASISLFKGWNFISSPTEAPLTLSKIEESCTLREYEGYKIYVYDPATRSWLYPNEIKKDEGGYVYASDNCTINLSGTPAKFSSKSLVSGWNTISTETSLNEIIGDCKITSEPKIWEWDAENETWVYPSMDDKLSQGKGYWIAVESDCTLGEVIPPPPIPTMLWNTVKGIFNSIVDWFKGIF